MWKFLPFNNWIIFYLQVYRELVFEGAISDVMLYRGKNILSYKITKKATENKWYTADHDYDMDGIKAQKRWSQIVNLFQTKNGMWVLYIFITKCDVEVNNNSGLPNTGVFEHLISKKVLHLKLNTMSLDIFAETYSLQGMSNYIEKSLTRFEVTLSLYLLVPSSNGGD